MKRWASGLMALALLAGTAVRAAEAEQQSGFEPGEWTMDLETALERAREDGLPVLLNFSGSDWCGWCKIMETAVFSKPAWKAFAAENLATVLIDFPQDESRVPEKYVERNEKLKETYQVQGFPTFVLLDDDGQTELGRLSAGRDKTPASFIAEIKALTRFRPEGMKAYAETLSGEDRTVFEELRRRMTECRQALREQKKRLAETEKQIGELEKESADLKVDFREFRVGQLDEEQRERYGELKRELSDARTRLKEWTAGEPERTPDNMQKFQSMLSEIRRLEQELTAF